MAKIAVLYHGHCADGFTAAWAAWKKLGDKAKYIAVNHGEPVPEWDGPEETVEHVYLLDFCYPLQTLRDGFHGHAKVTILDHHKSAKADLATLLDDPPKDWEIVFDMEKSGAMLAWEHFHPSLEAPNLVKYVQDRDLWQKRLPFNEEIHTYSSLLDFDFDTWDRLREELESPLLRKGIAEDGASMLRYRDSRIARITRNPGFTIVGGHKVPCVNDGNWQSEIGNVLAKEHYFSCIWFMEKSGKIIYSLRSDKDRADEVADVSEIAKMYGGGGHRHAAGFTAYAPPIMFPPEKK